MRPCGIDQRFIGTRILEDATVVRANQNPIWLDKDHSGLDRRMI
jgi:hypothetical protein